MIFSIRDKNTHTIMQYYFMEVLKMKEVLEKVFEHPFGTAFLIGAVTSGVVRIVCAAKGIKSPQAVINVTSSKDSIE